MWAIVVVLLQALTGPETHVVTQAGVFSSEEACKASIASSVPAKLDGEALAQFKDGYAAIAACGCAAPRPCARQNDGRGARRRR